MKKKLKFVGVISLFTLVIIVTPSIISKILEKSINQSLEQSGYLYKQEVKDAALIMSNQLPIIIDNNTTIKNIEYDEEKNIIYYKYEITGASKTEIENILPTMKNEQLRVVKNSTNNKAFIKAKVTFKYIYTDVNGLNLGSFEILPNDYL